MSIADIASSPPPPGPALRIRNEWADRRFVFFFSRPSKALRRTQRSYDARARKVAALALELFDKPGQSERDAHRLRRQLVRLNEAALMIDAQLGDPSAVTEGSSAQLLHQRLFDVELALTNVDARPNAARAAAQQRTRSRRGSAEHRRDCTPLRRFGNRSGPGEERMAGARLK
jgi:hypothetical protein